MIKTFYKSSFLLFYVFLSTACHESIKEDASRVPNQGIWRMTMDINGHDLPFNFELIEHNKQWEMVILNAEERIEVDEIVMRNDSLLINLPVFESSFYLSIIDPNHLEGEWVNYYKSDDYKIIVKANYNESFRFSPHGERANNNLKSRYKVFFNTEDEEPYPAIGLFKNEGKSLSGTFATETGDYRHLEGDVIGDSLFLSTFDGSHAFLFKAEIKGDSLKGTFWSGTHYKTSWLAEHNEKFELRNPDSLTFIKEGYDRFDFSLPDLEGNLVSPYDEQFKNKVLIVQIMGSWCPNCLDETNYLSNLYKTHKKDGLEVIALAFERTRSKERAVENLKALKTKTDAQYTMLLGGATRDETAEKALPMLNHIMSYPTAIFIDRTGKVRKIHTGFYGPGTGKYYDDFTKKTEALLKNLLEEEI